MQDFASYGWALAAVALYGVMAQVLNAATGIRKGKLKMVPGAHHEPDFNNPAYRLDRAYMNSIETMVFYTALVLTAVMAGADPLWVNILAVIGFLLRASANVLYLRGVGGQYGGLRTGLSIGSSVVNISLALLTFAAAVWYHQ